VTDICDLYPVNQARSHSGRSRTNVPLACHSLVSSRSATSSADSVEVDDDFGGLVVDSEGFSSFAMPMNRATHPSIVVGGSMHKTHIVIKIMA